MGVAPVKELDLSKKRPRTMVSRRFDCEPLDLDGPGIAIEFRGSSPAFLETELGHGLDLTGHRGDARRPPCIHNLQSGPRRVGRAATSLNHFCGGRPARR